MRLSVTDLAYHTLHPPPYTLTLTHILTQHTHSARVLRVERCVTDDGAYAQRTSYALERQGMPTQQFQRTVVIRPADNRRPNDPNLPPSYDTAITGKDKSVKVEENGPRSEPTLSPGMGSPSHSPLPPPSAPLYEFSTPPVYTGVSQALPTLPTAPEEKENQVEDSDTALLLP